MNNRFLFLVAAFLLLPCVRSPGDIAPITQDGYALFCQEGTHIQMVSEEVRVTLFPSHSEVTATFLMLNTGPATNITIGFPRQSEMKLAKGQVTWKGGVQDLQITVSGEAQKLDDTDSNMHYWRAFSTWQHHFADGEKEEIKVRYWVSTHTGYRKVVDSKMKKLIRGDERVKSFSYVLLSGKTWKGPIGKAAITIDLSKLKAPHVYAVSPHGFDYRDKVISWHVTALEPTEYLMPNIRIAYFDGEHRDSRGEPTDLRKIAARDWRAATNAISAVADDRTRSLADRIGQLAEFMHVYEDSRPRPEEDWRILRHAYRTADRLAQQLSQSGGDMTLSMDACCVLGRAQSKACWPRIVATLTSDTSRRNALLYMGHFYSPSVVPPLLELVESEDDDDIVQRAASILLRQREYAIVPVLSLLCRDDTAREKKHVLARLALDIIISPAPQPGGFPRKGIAWTQPMTEDRFRHTVIRLIEYASGTTGSFPRPAASAVDTPWPGLTQDLYRIIHFGWYADHLAGTMPRRHTRETGTGEGHKLYVDDKLMKVGNLWRDDKGRQINMSSGKNIGRSDRFR